MANLGDDAAGTDNVVNPTKIKGDQDRVVSCDVLLDDHQPGFHFTAVQGHTQVQIIPGLSNLLLSCLIMLRKVGDIFP